MRAHSDPMALENSFLSVLQANSSTDDASLVSLRRHCLEPGIYHIHILRWLQHYKPKQVRFCTIYYGYRKILLEIFNVATSYVPTM